MYNLSTYINYLLRFGLRKNNLRFMVVLIDKSVISIALYIAQHIIIQSSSCSVTSVVGASRVTLQSAPCGRHQGPRDSAVKWKQNIIQVILYRPETVVLIMPYTDRIGILRLWDMGIRDKLMCNFSVTVNSIIVPNHWVELYFKKLKIF